jgi:hypothetical protein
VLAGSQSQPPEVFQADKMVLYRDSNLDKYKYDFRWMPELHAGYFYPDGDPLKRVNGTRLAVHTGTLYTRVRTTSTFSLIPAKPENPTQCQTEIYNYGHIALFMATAISASSDVLLLKRNGRKLYRFRTGNKYQVVFRNEREIERGQPHHDPKDCNEELRNDFHFSRKVVNAPAGRPQYGLTLKQGCSEGDCGKPDFCVVKPPRFTDEAPCSGAGYGLAAGFP